MNQIEATIAAVSIDFDGSKDDSVDKEYILNICSNLVMVNESFGIFQLAHLVGCALFARPCFFPR